MKEHVAEGYDKFLENYRIWAESNYDFGDEDEQEVEVYSPGGASGYLDKYIDDMALKFGIVDSPYKEGKYCSEERKIKIFIKEYNTKVVLSKDFIRVRRYSQILHAKRYDVATGKKIMFHPDNSANKIDKFVDFAYTNAEMFKTYITLTFEGSVDYDEAMNALSSWLANAKSIQEGFKYVRVIAKGKKNPNKIHFHLLTTLDVDAPIFVKANVKKKNVYNVTDWTHGYTKASKIKTLKDLTKISIYIGKHINRRPFKGKRTLAKSNGFSKQKVLYFDDSVEQDKIDVLIKDAVEVTSYEYPDYWGGTTRVKIFKRGADAIGIKSFKYPTWKRKKKVFENYIPSVPSIYHRPDDYDQYRNGEQITFDETVSSFEDYSGFDPFADDLSDRKSGDE